MSSNNASASIVDKLKQIPFFNILTQDDLLNLSSRVIKKHLNEGETVFTEGDASAGLYWLESGWVKIVKYSTNGREQILSFIKPPQTFNEVGAFSRLPNPASAVVLEPAEIWIIPKPVIAEFIHTTPAFAQHVIETMALRLNNLVTLVEDLSLRQVTHRLARLILSESVDGVLFRPSWYTQSELASRLGTVADVVQRSLRKLEDEGLVRVERDQIVILDRLKLDSLGL
ncbi:MAG: Crp/Fnr family transcriptional regulator [Anaerolineae bacterium]|nr:Crp/Fnr family transcriptional regulator [Anaerolineae bacterium]